MREEEDHRKVNHRRHAQCEGESLQAAHREHVQHNGSHEVHRVRNHDGAFGSRPSFVDGCHKRATVTHLVADAFEVDDERVSSDANCNDQANNAGQ